MKRGRFFILYIRHYGNPLGSARRVHPLDALLYALEPERRLTVYTAGGAPHRGYCTRILRDAIVLSEPLRNGQVKTAVVKKDRITAVSYRI